jgi:hypothetical protein
LRIQCTRQRCQPAPNTRRIAAFGGTLESLDPTQVSNLQAALANARAFAGEVVAMLRQSASPSLKAEVA